MPSLRAVLRSCPKLPAFDRAQSDGEVKILRRPACGQRGQAGGMSAHLTGALPEGADGNHPIATGNKVISEGPVLPEFDA